ncbi:hypothetical protein [Erwinia sp. 198]|uniref:hypothetical protein n=1 Tax=Erwinia sp. 198 TaxID=2022746 RepID=UPI000F65FDA8|nr:hypothetical protein [Erwinia sp. 198]RRZ88451.1 hypothetical protein EGK14_17215 [Erwinia sp. 198]
MTFYFSFSPLFFPDLINGYPPVTCLACICGPACIFYLSTQADTLALPFPGLTPGYVKSY